MVCTFHAKNSIQFCEFHAVLFVLLFFSFLVEKIAVFLRVFLPLFLGHLFFIFFDKSTYFFSEKIYVVYIYNVTIMVQVERLQSLGGKFCLLFFFLKMKKKKGFIPKSLEMVESFCLQNLSELCNHNVKHNCRAKMSKKNEIESKS